jgi:hypothetical protein
LHQLFWDDENHSKTADARVGLEAQVGLEPMNGGFADQSWISILLVRLAFTLALLPDFGPYLGPIVPKLFPKLWGEPLRWHNFLGHSLRFCMSVFLHVVAGEGVWGRGRHLNPCPQQPFRNLFVVHFVHKNLDRCASIFGLAFGLGVNPPSRRFGIGTLAV